MLKKSHLVIGLTIIIVVLVALCLPASITQKVRGVAMGVVAPFSRFFSWIGDSYSNIDEGLKDLEATKKEAERLREENARLATENIYFRDLRQENARLREMLGFKQASPFQLLACRVVSRDASSWWNTVIVNRGWNDNHDLPPQFQIAPDLPVVSPRGVVGKTGAVSGSTTEVILMFNENCKIAGTIENSRVQGLVVGEGNLHDGLPRARMKFIVKNAEIAVGERVFTSGLAGVFPPGLQLGTISEVLPLSSSVNFGLYREAIVQPVVDFTNLDELFIVLGSK